MHDGVGRAADREHGGDGVVDRIRRDQIRRLQIVPDHVDDAFSRTRRHDRVAESAAGIEAAPGNVMPSASAALVMVEAVPIVMQCPASGRCRCSISPQSSA